jgi:hypothetical protein
LLTLSPVELHQLTGYKTREKQRAWLTAEGVPYRCDSHGRLIVLASHVASWVAGVELRPSSAPRMDMVT